MRAWLFAIFVVTTLVFTFEWFGPPRSSPEWHCSTDCAVRGRQLEQNLFQLTGLHLQVGQTSHPISELADPAPPYFAMSGAIEIYGTADYFLSYENWHEFKTGGSFERRPLDLRYPNGEANVLPPWDLRKYAVFDGQDLVNYFLVGASMNATGKGGHPVWPQDNATRSIYFYEEDNGRWIRRSTPIVWNAEPTWEGHSYGGNFLQLKQPYPSTLRIPKSDDTYFFYERSHIVKDGPYGTEIFGRTVHGADFQASDIEVKVLSAGVPPYPSTRRANGGFLIEGPRVTEIVFERAHYFILVFSSGDFPTDSYGINYAWSIKPLGPYQPALTGDGTDLLDLSQELKKKYSWSWVGRPALYATPDGTYEMLFHAVEKRILPKVNYKIWPDELGHFFRSLFKCKVSIVLDQDNVPRVALDPGPRG